MKILVGSAYSRIKSLSFAPEVDLTGQSISVDEFTADVITRDSVAIGQCVQLYDDMDALWARYWITYAERLDAHTLRIRAKSLLVLMEQDKLPAFMYDEYPLGQALDWIFRNAKKKASNVYRVDESFSEVEISGFCPEQSARERLMWICFSIGAYVRSCFSECIEILPIGDGDTLIPIEKTFWKPSVTWRDHVTAVKAKYYSFEAGDPETTDKWVKDFLDNTYIVTEHEATLTNPNVPESAPDNVVGIEGVYILNEDNVSGVLNHLAKWHFNRASIALDVIDNAEFLPGQRVIAYADEEEQYSGYIESCSFAFGVQARATIQMIGTDGVQGEKLVITYVWDGTPVGKSQFLFPAGYGYSIVNPYIDSTLEGHRYIFRPLNEVCTGTIVTGVNAVTEPCRPALDLFEEVLEIISVDEMTADAGIVEIK